MVNDPLYPFVDLNSQHMDPYDQAKYNHSLTTSSSEFGDSLAAFRSANPQLVSPRPTLPSSQYSSSWYDWPREAPAETYQVYPDQDTSQLERYNSSIQAEIQHSFENQQVRLGSLIVFF